MKTNDLLHLYPPPARSVPLQGLYLSHDLRTTTNPDAPFVYSNYVISLDGRIAVPHPSRPGLTVPETIANDRDWQLFQELAVQADVLFTSGRYLRDYADGRAQEILRVYDDPRFEYLRDWRRTQGLTPQPDLAVISASLDFPIPEALRSWGRRVCVITTRRADPQRINELQTIAEVVTAGDAALDGGEMIAGLYSRGYRLMYNATGPRVLHLILAGERLDRLYLTHANKILGGTPYATIVEGDLLRPPADFKLHTLVFDPSAPDGLGQLFVSYNRA